MNSRATKFTRLLVIAAITSLIQLPSSMADTQVSDQQINPTPDPCCNCISMTVSGQIDKPNPSGKKQTLRPSTKGDYTAKVTVTYGPRSGSAATCTGSQAVIVTANVLKNGVIVYSQDSVSTTVSTSAPTATIDFTLPVDKAALGDSWEFKLRCADKTAYCSRISLKLDSECEPCKKCQDTECPSTSTQSFDVDIPTGRSNGGMSEGKLTFYAQSFANPGRSILFASVPSEFVVNRDGNGIITSITTGTGTVEVSAADVALLALDTNAFVVTHKDASGAVYRTTTISLVTESGVARFRMDSTFEGSTIRHEQTQPVAGTLVMEKGKMVGGVFESLSQETLIKIEPNPSKTIYRRIIKERATPTDEWEAISDVETTWENQVDGWQLTKEVIDPDGAALTSIWTYYQPGEITGSGSSNEGLGRLKRYASYDGSEAFYTYSLNQSTVTTPYAGNVSGKVQVTSWDPGSQTMTEVTTINGIIIAKTVSTHTATTTTETVYTSATDALTAVTTLKPAGQDFGGKPTIVQHNNGTLSTYAYTRNAGGGYTTVKESGSTIDGSTVAKGTRNISTINSRGTVILSKTEAIGYSTGSAIFAATAVTSIDYLGRPLVTAFYPTSVAVTGEVAAATNPAWVTNMSYSCCGVSSETDAYGVITYYAYDHLQREIKSNSLGVTIETHYKGLTTETHRYTETVNASLTSSLSSDSTTIISKDVSNLAGTLEEIWRPDPTSSVSGALIKSSSITTTYHPASELSSRTIVTKVDNYSQTTDSFLDGRTAATYGDLGSAKKYTYTINSTGELSKQAYTSAGNYYEVQGTQKDWYGREVSSGELASFESNTLVNTTIKGYDQYGRIVKSTDPDGVTTLLVYNSEGQQVITAIDLNANNQIDYGVDTVNFFETEPALDNASMPVWKSTSKIWQPGDTSPTGGTLVSLSIKSVDELHSSSQSIGVTNLATSATTLNGNGNWVKTETYPDGTKQVENYDSGLLTSSSVLNALNSEIMKTIYTYDALNREVSSSKSRTGSTIKSYISYSCDAVASVTAPGSRITTFSYDIRERQIAVDYPDTVDADGNTLANITTTSYLPDGHVAEINGDQTYRVSYAYDYADRKISMTTFGASPATTTWQYSATRGHLLAKRDATNKGVNYTYTAAHRIASRNSAEGVTTSYSYDLGGRMVSANYSDITPDITMSYDAIGRKITQSNGIATSSYTYNPSTLAMDTETVTYNLPNQPAFSRMIDRSQDNLQRDIGWQLKNGTTVENEVTYSYGSNDGRLGSISKGSASYSYTYTPNSGLIESVTSPVHTVSNVYETDRNVLASKVNKVGTTIISSYLYSLNNLGQRTGVNSDGSAFTSTRNIAWGYNAKGEVVKADSSITGLDRAYEYDGIGNRQKSADSLTLPATNNYTVNSLNQYTAINANNPTYDDDGNATAYPLPTHLSANSTLTWDGESRLISAAVSGGNTINYFYDSQSRRIAETVGSNTIIYVYDGWNPIAEYGTSGILAKTFTWGMDLSRSIQGAGGVGGLLAVTDGSGTYYPTYDGNGNVSEYLDSTGAPVAHYEYDPFGRSTAVTGSKANDFAYRFSTKSIDTTTGLYYFGYRFYDPETGRWPSRDPIEERGGLNLYGFVNNNVVDAMDILGMFNFSLAKTNEHIEAQTNLSKAAKTEIKGRNFKGHADFSHWGQHKKDDNTKCHNGKKDIKPRDAFEWTLADEEDVYKENVYYDKDEGSHKKGKLKHKAGSKKYKNVEEYHFLTTDIAKQRVEDAITACDKKSFVLYMHGLQDSYVHRGNGHKTKYNGKLAHAWNANGKKPQKDEEGPDDDLDDLDGTGTVFDKRYTYIQDLDVFLSPDLNNTAWNQAELDTIEYVKKWNNSKCSSACKNVIPLP